MDIARARFLLLNHLNVMDNIAIFSGPAPTAYRNLPAKETQYSVTLTPSENKAVPSVNIVVKRTKHCRFPIRSMKYPPRNGRIKFGRPYIEKNPLYSKFPQSNLDISSVYKGAGI